MPATINAEYTHPSTGVKTPVTLRVDVAMRRADKNPDGSDNITLSENLFIEVSGPAGTDKWSRYLDGHLLDSLLAVADGATKVVSNNGGTPTAGAGLQGVCGIISQLERAAIPTNVAALYKAQVLADSDITEDVGNTGDDIGAVSGTYSGSADADWDVKVTTAGTYDGTGRVTVYEHGTVNVVKAAFAPVSGVPTLIANGVSVTLTDGGDALLTLNDKWLIENTAPVTEGIYATWTDSPDMVASYYKVVALSGTNFGTETIVDECIPPADGGSGALVAKGVQQRLIESLNDNPGTYKIAVYATAAATATTGKGLYNQSLRSNPSASVIVP